MIEKMIIITTTKIIIMSDAEMRMIENDTNTNPRKRGHGEKCVTKLHVKLV